MTKCSICGCVATHEITPYTGATPGTMVNYCEQHAMDVMENEAVKTFKVVKKGHVYQQIKVQLNSKRGGYVK